MRAKRLQEQEQGVDEAESSGRGKEGSGRRPLRMPTRMRVRRQRAARNLRSCCR